MVFLCLAICVLQDKLMPARGQAGGDASASDFPDNPGSVETPLIVGLGGGHKT